MAVYVGATGTATSLSPGGGSYASGTATCTSPGEPAGEDAAADGTAEVDRTEANAWLQRERTRIVGASITIDGVAVPLVLGDVRVRRSIGTPIAEAEFSVAAEELAYFDPDTWAAGEHDVEITFHTGEPPAIVDTVVFTGHLEAARNEGNRRPRGSLRAVSAASAWAGKIVCVRGPAFSGKRWGQILREAAESIDVTITNANIDSIGRVVQKPYDIVGLTLAELAARVLEIDGMIIREGLTGGTLEVLEEDALTAGSPVYAFDEANIITISEEPPQRPANLYHLSGTKLADSMTTSSGQVTTGPDDVIGTDANGNPLMTRTWVTTDQGVELWKRVEYWETFEPEGVALGPNDFQIRRAEEISSTWETVLVPAPTSPPYYRYTTRLMSQRTRRWEVSGIPCDTSTGYLWVTASGEPGGRYTTQQASLILVSDTLETDTWNLPSAPVWLRCTLARKTIVQWGYYSELVDPADVGAHEYVDGSWRADDIFPWQVVAETEEAWEDSRGILAAGGWVGSVKRRVTEEAFHTVGRAPDPNNQHMIEEYGIVGHTVTVWTPNPSNTRHAVTTDTADPRWFVGTRTHGSLGSSPRLIGRAPVEYVEGPVPGAPRGSVESLQIQQEVMLADIDLRAGTEDAVEVTETSPYAESLDDLLALAVRRGKRARRDTVIIESRDVPALREGDYVSITNRARHLDAADAFISEIERRRAYPGIGRMTVVLKIPAAWP